MNPALYAMLRSGVQYVLSYLLSKFVIVGTALAMFGIDPATAVDWVLGAGIFGGYVWAANWLGTRTGDGRWAKAARLAAKLMMLGLTKTPNYGQNSGGSSPSTPDGQ